MHFSSVKNKIILSVSLILCIPCILIGWSSYETASKQLTEKTLEGMRRDVQLIDVDISKTVELREKEIMVVAGIIKAGQIGPKKGYDDPEARRIIDTYRRIHSEMSGLVLGSENGVLMISPKTTKVLDPNYDPRTREWYKLAMSNKGKAVLSSPFAAKVEGARMIVSISAMTSDELGAIGVSLPLIELTQSVNQVKFGKYGFVYMLDNQGKVIAHPTEKLGEEAKSKYFKQVFANKSGTINYEVNGKEKRAVFLTNELTGWKIVGEIDQREIDDAVRPIFNVTVTVLVVAILLAAFLILLIVRSITKPLQMLAVASEQVSQGDLTRRVSIKSKDEFQMLGNAYNQMIGSLQTFAFYDPLTNLPNRRQLAISLETAISRSTVDQTKLAVIFLDVDNFKRINDTLGHSAGDELLQKVADRIQLCIGSDGMVTRFGGDEFVILIDKDTNREKLEQIASLMKNNFSETFAVQDKHIYAKISMGISIFPEDGKSGEELLKNADTAMYRAKESGKNGFQFFNSSMNDSIVKKSRLEQALRNALKNNHLHVQYQPQIEIATGNIRGFEALARWTDPELGSISPAEFIPVAEESGLILEIDEWVMRQACMQIVEWQAQFGKPFMIAVNVSAVQLKRHDFAEKVQHILEETKLNPEHLEIEITESVLIESFEKTSAILQEVKGLGVKIALDDFGTGYSSLNYLKKLPTHTMKIDKTFIQDMLENVEDKAIVESIITLVHKLEQLVVAEGVETEEQLEILKEWGCDIAQGYLISKPLPADSLSKLVTMFNSFPFDK